MPTASSPWRLNGRPVVIADYNSSPAAPALSTPLPKHTDTGASLAAESLPSHSGRQIEAAQSCQAGLRECFPAAGSTFEGGQSDGYCFSLEFRSSNAQRNLEMISAFLREHGYGHLPLPADIKELRAFRLPRRQRKQLQFFADDGYVHNPIKILFPPPGATGQSLRLEVYNETAEGHLLRFHGRA